MENEISDVDSPILPILQILCERKKRDFSIIISRVFESRKKPILENQYLPFRRYIYKIYIYNTILHDSPFRRSPYFSIGLMVGISQKRIFAVNGISTVNIPSPVSKIIDLPATPLMIIRNILSSFSQPHIHTANHPEVS